jgi:serpin B
MQQLDVYLPQFEMSFGASLVKSLEKLGIVDAFDSAYANLSGMTAVRTVPPLMMDEVMHSAYIRVDENGTEAATATAVSTSLGLFRRDDPITMRIDRPFLFAIRDTVSGTLLFTGRVLDPGR